MNWRTSEPDDSPDKAPSDLKTGGGRFVFRVRGDMALSLPAISCSLAGPSLPLQANSLEHSFVKCIAFETFDMSKHFRSVKDSG